MKNPEKAAKISRRNYKNRKEKYGLKYLNNLANKSNKTWRKKFPEKRSAHQAVYRALRKGTLKKSICEVCGVKKVEAHHSNYSKPLDVIWLCTFHHNKFGKGLPKLF